jgi:hypothetical protein
MQAATSSTDAVVTEGERFSGDVYWWVMANRDDIKGEKMPIWEIPTLAFTKPEAIPAPRKTP